MDKAYSLIKRAIVPAEAISYRENISNQLICYECGEPVFKKEMWVESRDDKTHFLSHYVGDPTSCKERAHQNKESYSDHEKRHQLQKLSEFDATFREQIKNALQKLVSKEYLKKSLSNVEFSEKIAVENLRIGTINSLVNKAALLVSENLEDKIDSSLAPLDKALIPIRKHLLSQFGDKNLRFLTCVALIHLFKSNPLPIEDMLKSSNIKTKDFFDERLFSSIKIILSVYINFKGSIEKIIKYAKLSDKNELSTGNPKKLAKICTKCNRVHYTNEEICDYCNGNKRNLVNSRSLGSTIHKTNEYKSVRIEKNNPINPKGVLDAKLCEYCQKYSYTREESCPRCFRSYKNLSSGSSTTHILPDIANLKEKSQTSKIEVIDKQYCDICKKSYISSTPNSCPFCFKKIQSDTTWKYCDVHRQTYLPKDGDKCPRCVQPSGWLAKQPWDEANLRAHQSSKAKKYK